jgi:hypothetical protein
VAWLERLDSRAARRSPAVRWPYLAARAFLIALGAYLLAGMLGQRYGLWTIQEYGAFIWAPFR